MDRLRVTALRNAKWPEAQASVINDAVNWTTRNVADPIVRALMLADRVDPEAFESLLRGRIDENALLPSRRQFRSE